MKRIICWLRTLWEFDTWFMALINYGAFYVAHDYKEVFNGYRKSRKRYESKLVCQRCGNVSIAWHK
jgi:hypothetical protein